MTSRLFHSKCYIEGKKISSHTCLKVGRLFKQNNIIVLAII